MWASEALTKRLVAHRKNCSRRIRASQLKAPPHCGTKQKGIVLMENNTEWNRLAVELRGVVEEASQWLGSLSEDVVSKRPEAGQWSAKEILGHLVDSAVNNHQRFVRLQITDDLQFPDYSRDNDRWVAIQDYNRVDWKALIQLWRHVNIHLARIIAVVDRRCIDNAWRFDRQTRYTLGELMIDYPVHMNAHLKQIEAMTAGK
jgi:hypothetical protein